MSKVYLAILILFGTSSAFSIDDTFISGRTQVLSIPYDKKDRSLKELKDSYYFTYSDFCRANWISDDTIVTKEYVPVCTDRDQAMKCIEYRMVFFKPDIKKLSHGVKSELKSLSTPCD